MLNGKVITVDAKFSIAEAAAIRDGVLIHVGSNVEEQRLNSFIGVADWLRGEVKVAINTDHMSGVDPNTSLNPFNPFTATTYQFWHYIG